MGKLGYSVCDAGSAYSNPQLDVTEAMLAPSFIWKVRDSAVNLLRKLSSGCISRSTRYIKMCIDGQYPLNEIPPCPSSEFLTSDKFLSLTSLTSMMNSFIGEVSKIDVNFGANFFPETRFLEPENEDASNTMTIAITPKLNVECDFIMIFLLFAS